MGLLSRIKSPLSRANWAMAWLSAFVRLIAFLGALEAFATDPSDTHPAWTNSKVYVECGQDCLYQKGNENVTLQAIYIVKKMDNLERTLKGGNQGDANQVIQELKLYCPDVSATSDDEADANLCYKRYVQTQLPVLRAIKATLVKNEDMTARLKSDQGAFGGSSKASAFQDETPGPRKAQTPEFSKVEELMTPEAGARLRALSQQSYVDWASKVASLAPKREDFPLTQKAKKDPSDPYSIDVNKIVRDKLGSPVIDEKAYQQAKQEFESHILGKDSQNHSVNYDLKQFSKQYAKSKIGDVDTRLTAPLPKGKPSPTGIEDISYRQARNLLIESESNLFARGVMPTKTYTGPPRSPAATASGKPAQKQVTPGFGYDETVTKPLNTTKEEVANSIPKSGANTTYSLTLSPEQLDKSIAEFQKSADELDVK